MGTNGGEFTRDTEVITAKSASTLKMAQSNHKIKSEPNKRSKIIVATNAHEVVEAIPLSERIVRPFDVDHICDKIFAGDYAEQQDAEFMMGLGFLFVFGVYYLSKGLAFLTRKSAEFCSAPFKRRNTL